MTFDRNWHVPIGRLEGYPAGTARPVERFSIEAHLLACAVCRDGLAAVRPSASRRAS